jgi:hypothetical protein
MIKIQKETNAAKTMIIKGTEAQNGCEGIPRSVRAYCLSIRFK